jgi:hypothetical protein
MIDRELDILQSQGLIDPMPPLLKEAKGEYKVIYDSPISRSMKAEWASGAQHAIQALGQLAQMTGDPSYMFYVDFDKAAPEMAEIMGTPNRWLRTKDEVQKLKDAQAKQAQIQQAIAAAPAAAGLMKANAATGGRPRKMGPGQGGLGGGISGQ